MLAQQLFLSVASSIVMTAIDHECWEQENRGIANEEGVTNHEDHNHCCRFDYIVYDDGVYEWILCTP